MGAWLILRASLNCADQGCTDLRLEVVSDPAGELLLHVEIQEGIAQDGPVFFVGLCYRQHAVPSFFFELQVHHSEVMVIRWHCYS